MPEESEKIGTDETEQVDAFEDVGLSNEERDALKEDGADGDGGGDGGGDGDLGKDDLLDDDNEDNQDDKGKQAAVPDLEKDEPEKTAGVDEPEKPSEEKPEPPEDPLKTLETQLDELKTQFDEGDLSVEEYIDARSKIERTITRAEAMRDFEKKQVQDTWTADQVAFFDANAYLKANNVLYGAFASQVNMILQTPEGAAMSNAEVLAQAKTIVDEAFGRKPEDHAQKKEDKADPVKSAKQKAADRSGIPKTLRGVPPAESNTEGRFAYLDNLTGEKYESALAKLSPVELEAYSNEH